ncbi:ABC transporter ATP-binding protein [Bacillus sp. 1P10SD]|uniref:ABC transporter ATP-binding protein n=1 Tax=Bacillus sp. 1P10SD TaxID=3132265 RepID=UPI0039A40E62
MTNVVEVKNLKVHFDGYQGFLKDFFSKEKKLIKAVDGIDLEIKKGEIVSLVGESGSGKTTTGKALLSLTHQSEGEILFEGESVSQKNKKAMKLFRQKAQMIYQDPYQSLNPRNMILDIVAEPLVVNKLVTSEQEKKERVIQALESAGIKPAERFMYKYPHELSGGQRQRVVIASALILNPSFIVADEPVSMLDVSIRADILKLMVEQRDEKGISYLLITHDLSLAWLISDRIAIMYLGKIVEIGDAELIAGSCMHPYSKALVSVMPVPRKMKNRERIILKGETPNPGRIPTGCRFHPRCPAATDRCKTEEPALKEVDSGHYVACHLV